MANPLEEQLLQGKKELDSLKRRLDTLKTKAAVDLARLEQAKADAREQVGTDDLEALRTMKRQIDQENEALVKAFISKIAEIRQIIEQIEAVAQESK